MTGTAIVLLWTASHCCVGTRYLQGGAISPALHQNRDALGMEYILPLPA